MNSNINILEFILFLQMHLSSDLLVTKAWRVLSPWMEMKAYRY